jgi:hypothetical protein
VVRPPVSIPAFGGYSATPKTRTSDTSDTPAPSTRGVSHAYSAWCQSPPARLLRPPARGVRYPPSAPVSAAACPRCQPPPARGVSHRPPRCQSPAYSAWCQSPPAAVSVAARPWCQIPAVRRGVSRRPLVVSDTAHPRCQTPPRQTPPLRGVSRRLPAVSAAARPWCQPPPARGVSRRPAKPRRCVVSDTALTSPFYAAVRFGVSRLLTTPLAAVSVAAARRRRARATRRCQPPTSDTAARSATRAEYKKRAETLISISALSVEI